MPLLFTSDYYPLLQGFKITESRQMIMGMRDADASEDSSLKRLTPALAEVYL